MNFISKDILKGSLLIFVSFALLSSCTDEQMVIHEENIGQDTVSELDDNKITQKIIEEEDDSSMITVAWYQLQHSQKAWTDIATGNVYLNYFARWDIIISEGWMSITSTGTFVYNIEENYFLELKNFKEASGIGSSSYGDLFYYGWDKIKEWFEVSYTSSGWDELLSFTLKNKKLISTKWGGDMCGYFKETTIYDIVNKIDIMRILASNDTFKFSKWSDKMIIESNIADSEGLLWINQVSFKNDIQKNSKELYNIVKNGPYPCWGYLFYEYDISDIDNFIELNISSVDFESELRIDIDSMDIIYE